MILLSAQTAVHQIKLAAQNHQIANIAVRRYKIGGAENEMSGLRN
jgi:hypothetical protein